MAPNASSRFIAVGVGCLAVTALLALTSMTGIGVGDGTSLLVTSAPSNDIGVVISNIDAGSQAQVPEPPPPPPGKSVVQVVNGVEMLVNTRSRDYLTLLNGAQIEPIDLRLRKTSNRAIRRLRLLWPQVQSRYTKANVTRAWVDLGARFFLKGSTQWFIRRYPESKTFDAILFEVLELENTYPPVVRKQFKSFEYIRKAAWTHDRGVEVKGMKMAHVKEKGQNDTVKIAGDNRAVWSIDSIDMAAFLKSRFTRDDFVVLKMDIEGGEWELLQHLIATKAIDLVDELMLECHPRDAFASVDVMHQSCIDLTNHFRRLGIACHRWV